MSTKDYCLCVLYLSVAAFFTVATYLMWRNSP